LAQRAAKATERNVVSKNGDQKSQIKASSKSAIEGLTDPKNSALESAETIKKDQITIDNRLTKQLLHWDSGYSNNNKCRTIRSNTKKKKRKKIISSNVSKFAKGFRIPDDDMNKKDDNKK
jgi:hypothetical protein